MVFFRPAYKFTVGPCVNLRISGNGFLLFIGANCGFLSNLQLIY